MRTLKTGRKTAKTARKTARKTGRFRLRLVIATTLLAVLGTACLPAPPPPPPPPTVVVYGDSFTAEAKTVLENQLTTALPGWRVVTRARGGFAQCDFHPQMLDDASLQADLVIIEFNGNFTTPCIAPRGYGGYFWDALWAANLWHGRGAPILYVGGLGRVGDPAGIGPVGGSYQWVANYTAGWGNRFVDSSSLLIDPATNRYAQTLPCFATEEDACTAANDRINARSPDEFHLCNIPWQVPCSTYSSGVYRFALAITRAAAAMVGGTVPAIPGPVAPRVEIPNFTTTPTTYDSAAARLTALGLTVTRVNENSDTVAIGDVVRTNPAAEQKLRPGKSVTIYVSSGPVTTTSTTTTSTTTTSTTTTSTTTAAIP